MDEAEVTGYSTSYEITRDEETNAYIVTVKNTHGDDKKEVFVENITYNVDGMPVGVGQTLTYKIHYNNNTNAPAKVTVTDRVPENTEYVDGSADNGGVYDSGVITWVFEDVPAGGSGEVTFQVTVKEEAAGDVVENTGKVINGENEHDTNTVTNPVPKKDVFKADAPTVDYNGQNVGVGDELIYKVTYTLAEDAADDVIITDVIPDGTKYVDGSADNSGVYDSASNMTSPSPRMPSRWTRSSTRRP